MSSYYGLLQPPEDFTCVECGEIFNIDFLIIANDGYTCYACDALNDEDNEQDFDDETLEMIQEILLQEAV